MQRLNSRGAPAYTFRLLQIHYSTLYEVFLKLSFFWLENHVFLFFLTSASFFSFFKENDLFLSLWNVCLREEPFLFVETVAETAFQSSEEKMNLGHRLMFCIAYHLNLN